MAHSHGIRENGLGFGTRGHAVGLGWFRKGLSVGFGDTCHLPKGLRKVGCFGLVSERGFRKASPAGGSGSLDWRSTVRIHPLDRTEARIDRTGRESERCGPSDLISMARVDRLDRTERNIRAMGAVGS